MGTETDEQVRKLATEQHGAFSRNQAMTLGATYGIVRRRVNSGAWVPATPSTYTIAGSRRTWLQRVQIAVLDRPNGVVSGRTAAVLHGIPGFTKSRPEITVPFPGNGRAEIFRVHRCRHFEDIEVSYLDGFPVMSVEDTVFDLARRLDGDRLRSVIEDLVVKRISSLVAIEAGLERRMLSNCPSRTPVIAVLETINGTVSESELERRFMRLSEPAGLPPMTKQAPAPWWEDGPLRVDLTIPRWRLIIELDGRSWHTRQSEFERDRARDNQAVAAGWRVLRFSYRMVVDRPHEVIQTIREAGARAA